MSRPSVAELRAVCQPPGLVARGGEHWAGRLYMRRLSPYATWVFVRLGWSPNQVTWLMIACGVLSGPALLVPGIAGALLAVLCVQLYLLLDCADGEVARWTRRPSVTGVYLDRVGAFLTDASLLVGLGFRASDGQADGWAVLGLAAALLAVLVKVETDLVDVARARSGAPAVTDAAAEPRSARVGALRRAASVLGVHRVLNGIEASLLVLVAAVVDSALDSAGSSTGDLAATRALTAALALVAAVMLVLHLASILLSRRLTV